MLAYFELSILVRYHEEYPKMMWVIVDMPYPTCTYAGMCSALLCSYSDHLYGSFDYTFL